VEIHELTKRFAVRRSWAAMLRHPRASRSVLALDRVSFAIAEGEIFGLLGRNGAGKTTLLKVLSTLIPPDAGGARIGSYDLLEEPERVRQVVSPVVPEERSLNWRLTAAENLRFYATLYGLWGPARRRRMDELLELVGLVDTGDKIVGAFSSGMRQRLLVARALLARPRVLLLDEPTRSLDPVAARGLRQFFREQVAGQQACTLLLATHNAEEALGFCDRVGVLDRGRLVAMGAPGELLARVRDARYRTWARCPDGRGFEALERRGEISGVTRIRDVGEWTLIELDVAGGERAAAAVLAFLVADGVEISRFEKVEPPLAELIQRLAEHPGGEERRSAIDA
jgi:ABC-2 type transport system ATP-binding protein